MINIPFDQYQRYYNVTKLINTFRDGKRTFKILEVGANEHRNLEKFLPEDQITYLDINLPEHLKHAPNYVLGDATDMEFPDNQFNIVVALDVFEHIPENKRTTFVSELYRVSSDCFIITAPFFSKEVEEAEKRANAVYKSIFNEGYIWLEEHVTNGLPDINKLTSYLESRSIEHAIISHGDLSLWERLMTIHFVAAQNPDLAVYRQQIDTFYNSYLFENDYTPTSYRKICFATKTGKANTNRIFENASDKPTQDSLERFEFLEKTFFNLASLKTVTSKQHDTSQKLDFVQIFKNVGNEFNERESFKIEFPLDVNEIQISQNLENDNILSLRIDPSNYWGFFRLEEVKVINKENKGIDLSITGNHAGLIDGIYAFLQDDPYFLLNFNRAEDVSEIKLKLKRLNPNEAIASILDAFNQQIKLFEEQRGKDEKRIIESGNRIDELENEINESFQEKTNLMHQIEEKDQELSQRVEQHGREKEEKRQQIERLETDNQRLLNHIQMVEENLRMQQEYLREKNEALLAKEAALNSIYTSRSWIYLTKVKKIFGK